MQGERISHYHLVEKLGEGAFGVVWRGVHDHDDRLQVAIKCFKPHLTSDPAWATGLQTEYLALDRLDHRGIVRFRELVVRDAQIALVMELLRGQDLFDALEPGPLPLERAVEILAQLLEGLAHAHDQGMIHRDIKPSNVFICDDGRVKILDFGLSRAAEGTQASRSGMLSGTMQYLAPEAFDGKVSPAGDVYAVGLVAWQMLAGRPACPDGSLARQMRWHCGAGAPDVRTTRRDCPAWLADVVAMLVSPELGERPADGRAALALLREKKKPIAVQPKARRRPPSEVRLRTSPASTTPQAPPPRRPPPRRPPPKMDVRRPVSEPKVLALEDDSDLLDSVDEIIAAEAARRDTETRRREEKMRLAAQRRARESALSQAATQLQQQATATWERLERLRALGGPKAKQTVQRFIARYHNAAVQVEDDAGTHQQAVAVAEVGTARHWLEEQLRPAPKESKEHPESVVRREVAGVAFELVRIPAGSFQMGSSEDDPDAYADERPRHRVRLTRPLLLGRTPVTQALWEAVMGDNPSHFKGAQRPVETVTWPDAVRFCNALSEKEGLTPAYREIVTRAGSSGFLGIGRRAPEVTWEWNQDASGYRLPTEAEWEYAARAGQGFKFAGSDDLDAVGWYSGNSSDETHPVGQKAANRWQIHDMSGNVYEWCWDWYGSYEPGENTDPVGAPRGEFRVIRGGSWFNAPRNARVAYRDGNGPGRRRVFLGLRLARSAAPEG